MKAIDHLFHLLKQNANKQLNTSDIAQLANLSRSVVSGYLAQLYKKGLVEKNGTRPVYWRVKQKQSILANIIGYNGSLKSSIQAILQSILYPPNGLPIIITGPSGSGKSMLAKKIYQEAVELEKVKKSSSFVTLNTADYANNTELLSSVLFGYKKGAFTGAEKDTPGLLDKANNGYLFLDEVHRLSKTNQEKLFSLFDNGTFYPLGDVNHPHHVNIRLIFATTENLNKFLLKTFLRRIPLHITLPSFIDRPIFERMAIVTQCFKNEATRTHRSYAVPKKLLTALANKNYPGNIGTLENKVKIVCSKGFTNYPNNAIIPVENSSLTEETVKIDSQFSIHKLTSLTDTIFNDMQKTQDELISALKDNHTISDYKLIVLQHLRSLPHFAEDSLIKLFGNNIQHAIISILNNRYGIKTNLTKDELDQLSFAFSLWPFQKHPLTQTKELIKLIQQRYPRSFYLYRQLLKKINTHFVDSYYLWFFPIFANVSTKIESIRYTCILLAHGESTATSIQKVVNNLVNNYIFEAFNMPINASIDDIDTYVKKYVNQQKAHDKGIILLFDMGSLNQMFVKIKHSSNKQLLVINNLTTATALDVAIRVERAESFKEITHKAKHYGKYMGVQYFEGLSDQDNIIVSCLSGVGLSKAIKNIMQETLSAKKQIITMDYRDLRTLLDNHDISFFKNTNLIITTTDFKTDLDLPIINIYNVLDKSGFNELKTVLLNSGEKAKNVDNLLEKFLKFLTIEGIKDRLQFLNPNIVIDEVQTIVKKYQKYYNVIFSGKIKLNLYMHLSLMIERVILNKNNHDNPKIVFKNDKEKEFFSVSKTIFKPVEIKYNMKISNFEISLIYELLKDLI